jgi:hypothetical protein
MDLSNELETRSEVASVLRHFPRRANENNENSATRYPVSKPTIESGASGNKA